MKHASECGILTHTDENRPFTIETDASDYAIAGILSQYDESNELRLVAFYSRQLCKYDKELLVLLKVLNIGDILYKPTR
jgi:hypothetical protein